MSKVFEKSIDMVHTTDLEKTATYDHGVIETGPEKELSEREDMRQGLHQRHIQMIALAGTIGTGLFLGTGRAIARAGPAGTFIGYSIIGAAVAPVVLAVGEMGALIPLSGGVVRYSEYFVDPALAFANGWNLVYSFAVSIPSELVAFAVLVEFWTTAVSSGVWITIAGVLMIFCSLFFVRLYGELEFTFSSLKILLIIIVNIMALVIACGGGPSGQATGFTYWKNPGPFVQYLGVSGSMGRFLGVWTTLNNAIYAYSGIENITMAAAETKNPRRAIPQATKRIFFRVLIFYVLTVFMVGLVVPSNDPHLLKYTGNAAQSPFVIAANRAQIHVIPSFINAIVLTSAWSAGNSNMMSGPRVLFGLAKHNHAPKVFLHLNRFGIPWVAVTFYGVFMVLGYMSLSETASTVFNWLQDLVSVSTLVNWGVILITYLRFQYACKAQGIDRKKELPWAAPLQPYSSWAALAFFIIIYFTGGYKTFMKGHWDTETFISSYLNVPVVILLYFAFKYIKKTKIIPLKEVPIRPFIDLANANPEPAPKPKTGLRKLNILWG